MTTPKKQQPRTTNQQPQTTRTDSMPTSNLPATPETLAIEGVDPERVMAVLAATELGGINPFTLKQIRVPGAGGLTWTVPDEDGQGAAPMQYMDVILLHYHRARQYYVDPYDAT